jgi:hypothetical protein
MSIAVASVRRDQQTSILLLKTVSSMTDTRVSVVSTSFPRATGSFAPEMLPPRGINWHTISFEDEMRMQKASRRWTCGAEKPEELFGIEQA